ncbi:MAG: hypothetical protein QM639_12555 [Rhodocyclaceae bacterium]
MKHIVFCWELGGGMGHLVPLSLLAHEMARHGHRVTFVTSDIVHAARYLAAPGIQWVQAPRLPPSHSNRPLNNHADILRVSGYESPDSLHSLLGAWHALLAALRPDRVVCEYAPTAQLAANALRLPVVCIDNGFSVPPVSAPMPPLRDDIPNDPHALAASERHVLSVINATLERIDARPLPRFSCLYEDETWYRNWPEFNHFGPHSPERHLGQIFGDTGGTPPAWPNGTGPKLFAYVKNDNKFIVPILLAAVSMGFRVLAYLPGQPATVAQDLMGTGRALMSAMPIHLSALDDDVEIGIWQSPTGGVGHSLEKGMRMLFLPTQVEQYRACRAVERSGVPAVVAVQPQNWHALIDNLMQKPRMHLGGRWQPADIPTMAKILGGY